MNKFKRRSFSRIEATEITEAMVSGKEPFPEGVKMETVLDPEPKLMPTIQWGKDKNNTYILFPGCWLMKCLETGELGIYATEKDFRQAYIEDKP